MMKTTLVVMAAGMGSRFGGLKQIEPIGKNGEVIIDYSAYDAIKAGFDKIVFIIKKEIENDFKKVVGDRITTKIDVEYVYQESPMGRSKPYGTAHAILCCKDVVKTPFAVINADDFYGATAFEVIHNHLTTSTDYAMVGFALENTVTENGTVARGICDVVNGYLTNVKEYTAIPKDNDFPKDTIVSMNMWGFTPSIFDELSIGFENFLNTANLEKDEYFIPSVVDDIIKKGKAKVRVLKTPEKWYGVTYKQDKDDVVSAINRMTKEGKYEGI